MGGAILAENYRVELKVIVLGEGLKELFLNNSCVTSEFFDVVLGEHGHRDLALLLGVVHTGREGWVDAAGIRDHPRLTRLDEVGRRLLEGAAVAVRPPSGTWTSWRWHREIVEYVGASLHLVRVG